MKKLLLSIFLVSSIYFVTNAQFSVSSNTNATFLAQELAGPGVIISNATLVCPNSGGDFSGTFSNAPAGLGISDGVILSTGVATDIYDPAGSTGFPSTSASAAGDSDLDTLLSSLGETYTTNDACVLEFDIEVTGDSLSFNYVMGSEEYPNYVCGSVNDIFGFFISGPNPAGGNYVNQNVALIPGTTIPVSINTVNNGGTGGVAATCHNGTYSAFMNPNPTPISSVDSIAYTQLTTTLTARAPTVPCQTYHFKLAIADGGDWVFDSGVFLEAESFTSNNVTINPTTTLGAGFNQAIEGCVNGVFELSLDTIPDTNILVGFNISGTATNGVDYVLISDSILFTTGDSTATISINVISDTLTEGTETITLTSYTKCGTLGQSVTLEITDNYTHSASISSTFLCSPAVVTLSATGGQFYSWSDSTLLTYPDSSTTTTINPVTESTTFYLDGTLGTCTFQDTLFVGVSQSQPTFHIQDISCPGANNGMYWIELNDSAAVPFTYSFPFVGGTDSFINNIPSGSFQLASATDSFGCVFNGPFHIFSDPAGAGGVTYDYDSIPISCTDADDGEICIYNLIPNTYTLTIDTNGVQYDSINFTSNSDTFCVSSLAPGTYDFVILDDTTGCSSSFSSTFINPTGMSYSTYSTDVSCANSTDGSICIYNVLNGSYTASGTVNGVAFPAYNFTINADTFCMTNLIVGTYDITILNNTTGCSANFFSNIDEPDTLVPNINVVGSSLCSGGSIDSLVSVVNGGTMPYSYSWSSGPNTPNINSVAFGTYTLTVTDDNGCIADTSVNIIAPTPIFLDVAQDSALCFNGNSGMAYIDSISGGNPPFTYSWNSAPIQTTDTAFNLSAGQYNLVVTDINGCSAEDSVIVLEPLDSVSISLSPTTITCFGATGCIAATISGGNAPYTFLWSDGQTIEDPCGLFEGMHILTVTDANGCTSTDSVYLGQATDLVLTTDSTEASCYGLADGTTTVNVSGGTSGYMYSWDDALNQSTATATGLAIGLYTVIVTDANGCMDTADVNVSQPDSLETSITVMGTGLCAGGSIDSLVSMVSGGTTNYSYQWSSGPNTANISSVAFGSYTVTVTDANGCIDSASVTIIAPTPIYLSISQDSVLCYGENSGLAYVDSLSGGNPPFNFSWNNSTANNDTAYNMLAGNQALIVTDANGCSQVDSIEVYQPDSISISLSTNVISCFGGDTCIDATISGGISPYTYSWSSGHTTEDVCGLIAGTYTITVTDANGCTNTKSITITQEDEIMLSMNSTNIDCFGDNDGTATVTVTGGSGTYTYSWNDALSQSTATANNLAPGSYTVTVADATNTSCIKTANVNITQPSDSLSVLLNNLQDVLCNGFATGSIDVNIAGGTSPYTYNWTGGTNNEDLSGALANTYTITVTDDNSCTETFTDIINQPAAMNISLNNSTDVTCFGGNDGAIDINVSGGVGPYTYSWSNGPTTEDINTITSGSYTVTVTDANSCVKSETYTIGQASNVSISFNYSNYNGVNISCNGLTDGTVEAIVSGGNAPYTYAWDNAMLGNPITGLAANVAYTVTVTDANGCTYSQSSAVLTEPTSLTIDKDSTMITCAGYNDGTATATPNGGIAPYSYIWSDANAQTGATATGLSPGIYSCTITDANGSCIGNIFVTIIEPSAISVTTSIDSVKCWGDADGSITVTASGGNMGSFEYSIDGGISYQSSNVFTDLSAGIYDEIMVRQGGQNGCESVMVSETVLQPEPMFISINPEDTTIQLQESVAMAIIVDPATGYFGGGSYSLNDITSVSWSPTTGLSCTDCTNPNALVFSDVSYTATVLYSPYSCETSATATINIENNLKYFVPNSFSPNGDGLNDVFKVFGEGLRDLDISVYNRIGEKIFESSIQENGWDGTFKGVLQNPGVYTYYFKAVYLDDKKIDSKGSVTLIR